MNANFFTGENRGNRDAGRETLGIKSKSRSEIFNG
jgi:hypothetical protein